MSLGEDASLLYVVHQPVVALPQDAPAKDRGVTRGVMGELVGGGGGLRGI